MDRKNGKKIIIICGSAAILLILFTIVFVYLKINEDKMLVKRCYKENSEIFDELVSYFADLYEPGIKNITYDTQRNAIEKRYSDRNEWVLCDNEYVSSRITELQDRYADDSDLDAFYRIGVDYDTAGNMQMWLVVRNVKLKEIDEEERSRRCFLIYADEEYSGSGFLYFNRLEQKPFSGNWYYWSHSGSIG